MNHCGVTCDGCKKDIVGFRYKCLECTDFDLCRYCEPDYHLGHVLIRFADPLKQSEKALVKNILDRRSYDKPFLIQGTHDYEQCNECGRDHIAGYLYKCIDCHNFNLCCQCEKRNSKCITGNDHILTRFADPLSLNSFNKRFWKEILEIRKSMHESDDEEGLILEFTSELNKHEGVQCETCNDDIVGLRFKCIDCTDFELCSYCEPKNVHSGHLLVRFGKPLDSGMEMFLDKMMQMRSNPTDIVEDKENHSYSTISWTMNHAGITCDNCETKIYGFRYKCLDCADFDLCSFCQKKGHHDEHWMIRFTEPLDVNSLNQKFVQSIMKYRASDEQSNAEWNSDSATLGKLIQNCMICYKMPSEMIFLDCGHLCICSKCIDPYLVAKRGCPVCGLAIKSTHRAYY